MRRSGSATLNILQMSLSFDEKNVSICLLVKSDAVSRLALAALLNLSTVFMTSLLSEQLKLIHYGEQSVGVLLTVFRCR